MIGSVWIAKGMTTMESLAGLAVKERVLPLKGLEMDIPSPRNVTPPQEQQRTVHINYNHQCPQCKAAYIPFGEDEPCPRCELVEKKRFDFVGRAVPSAQLNLATNGSYLPRVWQVSSLADFVLYLCFEILEQHRMENGRVDIDQVAFEVLEGTDMAGKDYLRPHTYNAALAIYDRIHGLNQGDDEADASASASADADAKPSEDQA